MALGYAIYRVARGGNQLPLCNLLLQAVNPFKEIPPELLVLLGGRVMLVVHLKRNTAALVGRQLVPWHGEELLLNSFAQCVVQVAKRRIKPVFKCQGERVKCAHVASHCPVSSALGICRKKSLVE